MVLHFKSFLEKETGLTFRDFDELHEWSCNETSFWYYLAKYFEFDGFESNSGTTFDIQKTFFSDGIQLNSFPENSKLYKDRYLPTSYRNPAQQIIESFDKKTPDQKPAFIEVHETTDSQKFSKIDLINAVGNFQRVLSECQLKIGDRVFYAGDFNFQSFSLFLACIANGVIWSSAGPDIGTADLEYKIGATKPKKVFFTGEYRYKSINHSLKDRLKNISLHKIDFLDLNALCFSSEKQYCRSLKFLKLPWDFPALILFTSGSTGKAKPLLMSLNSILLQLMREVHFNYNVTENDTFYYQTSWGWNMWQWQLAAFSLGSSMVSYCGAAGYPTPREFVEKFLNINTSVFGGSPSLFSELLSCNATADCIKKSNVRLLLSTGSVLSKSMAIQIEKMFGKNVLSLSGGTEVGGALLAGYSCNVTPPGWLGGKVLGVNADIGSVNNDGVGELLLKSSIPALPIGLINTGDNRTIETSYFPNSIHIWQHGDLARKNIDGDFQILGRSDNVIKRKGIRIGPEEISIEIANEFNIVSCCFGAKLKDEEYLLVLMIETKNSSKKNPTERAIRKFLQHNLGFRYSPDLIVRINLIPRNTNGKIVTSFVRSECESYLQSKSDVNINNLKEFIKTLV